MYSDHFVNPHNAIKATYRSNKKTLAPLPLPTSPPLFTMGTLSICVLPWEELQCTFQIPTCTYDIITSPWPTPPLQSILKNLLHAPHSPLVQGSSILLVSYTELRSLPLHTPYPNPPPPPMHTHTHRWYRVAPPWMYRTPRYGGSPRTHPAGRPCTGSYTRCDPQARAVRTSDRSNNRSCSIINR